MEHESIEPQPPALPVTRHDGWSGDKMATFCETLAETAVVAEACDQAGMGISGAYAARRRNPVFAAAWDAALTIARERLADTLLARSMEGNVEQIYKDGQLIGERHLLDNRLGLAILKRLDRLAEARITFGIHEEQPASVRPGLKRAGCPGDSRALEGRRAPALRSQPFDWTLAVDALRTGDEIAVCQALALVETDKVEEVEDHHFFSAGDDDEPREIDLSDRCWKDGIEGIWLTDFPPPAGFTGYQSCDYGEPDERYERACTEEEVAILTADAARALAAERAEDEELREAYFDMLKAETPSAGEELHSDCEPASKRSREPASGSPSGEPD